MSAGMGCGKYKAIWLASGRNSLKFDQLIESVNALSAPGLMSRCRRLGSWLDVLVKAEEVCWIIFVFDRREPRVIVTVGGSYLSRHVRQVQPRSLPNLLNRQIHPC